MSDESEKDSFETPSEPPLGVPLRVAVNLDDLVHSRGLDRRSGAARRRWRARSAVARRRKPQESHRIPERSTFRRVAFRVATARLFGTAESRLGTRAGLDPADADDQARCGYLRARPPRLRPSNGYRPGGRRRGSVPAPALPPPPPPLVFAASIDPPTQPSLSFDPPTEPSVRRSNRRQNRSSTSIRRRPFPTTTTTIE